MKSPFSGMNPYIEATALWGDFHTKLITEICRGVSAALPRGYVARTSNRSYIVLVESEERKETYFEPDVKVTAGRGRKPPGGVRETIASAAAVDAETEPVVLRAFIEDDFNERFIDIYELEPERRLVTSIEVLSPSNKSRGSEGWHLYLRKRQALLLGKANLVEIDLLRDGTRMPMLDPLPKSPYYLLVARQAMAPNCRVWPAHFNRPLPTLLVPLSKPDPDIQVPLQPLIEMIYEEGRYEADIDYTKPLTPPLSPEEAAWLKQQLQTGRAPDRPPPRQPRKRRQ